MKHDLQTIYSDWKILPETEKHYICPLGIWKKSRCGNDGGGGQQSVSEGSAVQRRMLSVCFCYLIRPPPPAPSLLQMLLLFIHLSDLDQAKPHQLQLCYITGCLELPFQCIVFNLIFPSKAAAPVPLHNSSAPCPSLFSSHCCFAPPALLRPCVAPRESWWRGVGVGICGRVSGLIRPNRSHHFGTHTAHYYWLDVNSHEAEGWRRWSP